MTVPLRIVVAFHPKSSRAKALARAVYQTFMAEGAAPGLRIPVAFLPVREDCTPPEVDFDAAEHTVLLAVIDGVMASRARASDRPVADAWAEAVVQWRARAAAAPHHAFVPAAVNEGGFGLDGNRLAEASFVRLDREGPDADEELCARIAIASLLLLPRSNAQEPSLKLFISHAKADLPPEKFEGPTKEILGWLSQTPVDAWYDVKKIAPGASFGIAIEKGVRESNGLVCVLTDHWSDREWCRREMLLAKHMGQPIVIVDAIESAIPSLFTYIGNVRLTRWAPGRARHVANAMLLEAVRSRHALEILRRIAGTRDDVVVLANRPEGPTLRRLPSGTKRVLYPDPPAPAEELAELVPTYVFTDDKPFPVELVTPLGLLARWKRPRGVDLVGISLSGATDIDHWGASEEHLATFADDLVTMLLVAGLRVAYGGTLEHGGAKNDSVNYTRRLFGLVRSYSPLVTDLEPNAVRPIENYCPWPIHLDPALDTSAYGQEGRLVDCEPPPLDARTQAALGTGHFTKTTTLQRWAYAQGASRMRRRMAADIAARIALGGKLDGYGGLIPGVLEEIYLSRCGERKTPLFLLGVFGGATRLAIDLLLGHARKEATENWALSHVPGYGELLAEFRGQAGGYASLDEVAQQWQALGTAGIAAALGNGLNEVENHELFESSDVRRLVELILLGLARKWNGV